MFFDAETVSNSNQRKASDPRRTHALGNSFWGKFGQTEIADLDVSGQRPQARKIGGSGLCWSIQGRATTHCRSVRYITHCLGISGRTCVHHVVSRIINNKVARNWTVLLGCQKARCMRYRPTRRAYSWYSIVHHHSFSPIYHVICTRIARCDRRR